MIYSFILYCWERALDVRTVRFQDLNPSRIFMQYCFNRLMGHKQTPHMCLEESLLIYKSME